MKIGVFGLGYVGCVSAACLAWEGHQVIGVDINPLKVEMINQGKSPVIEQELDEILRQVTAAGRLRATVDVSETIVEADLSLICVGTPCNENGSQNLEYVRRVSKQIGTALAQRKAYHVVVLRSTVLPGSTEDVVRPILEEYSGKKAGQGFGLCVNPEFLREGSSVHDFRHPPFTLVGQLDARSGDILEELYSKVPAPVVRTSIRVAEMVKYVSNAFHALKVSFANEIGNICKQEGIDSHEVMRICCLDDKLNISAAYLKPGFAFGGSCLPKDLRALIYHGRHRDVRLPLLQSILHSNENQVKIALEMIISLGKKKVGILGLSFKAGTDDLRESPMVELVERLIGKGYHVQVYDRNVSLARLHGANKAYIEKGIPHIATLMRASWREVVENSEVIVIGNKSAEFEDALRATRDSQIVMDLVRIVEDLSNVDDKYQGICW